MSVLSRPPITQDCRVRIVSLLPSATEIVFALGLGDQLAGVSFECDHPAGVRTVPVVSRPALPSDAIAGPGQIDAWVRARLAAGEPLHTLDVELIRSIGPDLILAQDLCRVCAVPSGAVEEALGLLGCRAAVVSLDPATLDDVIACVGLVGRAAGRTARAAAVMAELRARLDAVRLRVAGLPRQRVFVLEWPDPPFNAGHWVPGMVEAAGGVPVLAEPGRPSRRVDWEEIAAEAIDTTIFSPCGYDLEGAVQQAGELLRRPEVRHLGRVIAVDGNAYLSRPGPRVVDGVELLADLLHPASQASDSAGARELS